MFGAGVLKLRPELGIGPPGPPVAGQPALAKSRNEAGAGATRRSPRPAGDGADERPRHSEAATTSSWRETSGCGPPRGAARPGGRRRSATPNMAATAACPTRLRAGRAAHLVRDDLESSTSAGRPCRPGGANLLAEHLDEGPAGPYVEGRLRAPRQRHDCVTRNIFTRLPHSTCVGPPDWFRDPARAPAARR